MRNQIILFWQRIISILVVLTLIPAGAWAGTKENCEEAERLYVAALACMSAYTDKGAKITFTKLKQDGWSIYPYSHETKYTNASFFYAGKSLGQTEKMAHIFAITGTDDAKDLRNNLSWEKVNFSKADAGQSAANIPMVHKGFSEYVDSITKVNIYKSGNREKTLLEFLLENPDEKVLLTGHSLGGAAAVLGGARFLEFGVKPSQLEIITFGAPAVGDAAFKNSFEEKLDITRVVNYGDPIPGSLQKVAGGYVQFGKEVEIKSPDYIKPPFHRIAAYLDNTMRNYFEARLEAQKEGTIPLENISKTQERMVYIAPVKNNLPAAFASDFNYMREILLDEYRAMLPGYVISSDVSQAKDKISEMQIIRDAKAAGCELVVFSEIGGHALKNDEYDGYVTLSQAFYYTEGSDFIRATSFSSSTKNLTPLIAFSYNTSNMNLDYTNWLQLQKQ